MNTSELKQSAIRFAKLTPEEIGAAYQGFALRLAPIVAGVYVAGHVSGEYIRKQAARFPYFLRKLGFNA
jgi:hypothetical protein